MAEEATEREPVTIVAVDDQAANLRLLDAVLSPRGYRMILVKDSREAVARIATARPDVVLLDVVMPELDGYQVCRAIRADPDTAYLPVIMITASGEQEKIHALEAGADDFVNKPFNQAELLARVASLARVKRYQDTISRQAAELRSWNTQLEDRVREQLDQLERVGRLRRFLSPQLTELVLDAGAEDLLSSHRREIVVLFCDLRGFTAFAESSEPEEVMGVLADYHRVLGELIFAHGGTLERFTGDGLMVFLNDPVTIPDAPVRGLQMAVAMREQVRGLAQGWTRRGHALSFGVGVAQGYATLGRIGFEGRYDYAAIGSVTNLAARLCDQAGPWQVLTSARVYYAAESVVVGEPVADLQLKGFSRPVACFAVSGVRSPTAGP